MVVLSSALYFGVVVLWYGLSVVHSTSSTNSPRHTSTSHHITWPHNQPTSHNHIEPQPHNIPSHPIASHHHSTAHHITSHHHHRHTTTSNHQNTTTKRYGWRLVHTKNSVWPAHWLVALRTFQRQILCLAHRFLLAGTSARGWAPHIYVYKLYPYNQ